MGDPDLHSDESVILTTPNVFVKSIPFEAILTNKRVILVDRKRNLIPPKDILLATIRDVEPGENAIRDLVITLSIITSSGETRQMVLTFSRTAGGGRKRERDEWVKALRKFTSSSLVKAIRKAVPSFAIEPKKKVVETTPPHVEITSRPAPKKEIEGVQPIKTIVETSHAPPKAAETTSLPYGSFCSRCGNRVPAGSVFCNRCGAKIIVPGQEVAGEPAAQPVPQVAVPAADRKERPIEQEIRSIEPLIDGSVPKTEKAPVSRPQIPTAPARSAVQQPAPQPAVRAQPQRRTKSIFPQLFLRKDLPKKPAKPASLPPQGSSAPPSRKKRFVAIALIVIVILAIAGGAFVYMKYFGGAPAGENGKGGATPTPTTAGTPRPTAGPAVSVATPTPVTLPAAGVWVRVDYLGSWKGSYGLAGALLSVTDSGVRQYQIENPNGTVEASIQKQDMTSHELVVEVYKNGALIKRGTTTAPQGTVSISVDPATAAPVSQTSGVIANVTQPAVATTAIPTTTPVTNITTTMTTVPVTTVTTHA